MLTDQPAPPFCANCKYFIPDLSQDKSMAFVIKPDGMHRCGQRKILDIITGILFNPPCWDMRHPEGMCKTEAVLFEEKKELVEG